MPTQRLMTPAEYITWTDYLAKAAEYLLAAVGDEDTAATAAYEARLARDGITALTDPTEYDLTVDLLGPIGSVVANIIKESTLQNYFSPWNAAVLSHLGQDLGAWLTAGGVRVHHLVKRCVNTAVPAVNVFPPVTNLGSMAVTGSGAGTFTDGQAVDTTRYGGAQIELEVTGNPIGVAPIEVTVNVTLANGTTTTKVGTIDALAIVGAKVALGADSDRIVNITNVTVTGGTNGDAFRVQTKEDRTI